MAVLNGLTPGVAFVSQGTPMQGAPNTTTAPDAANTSAVIDGTPIRVVVLALAAAAGLTALHIAGFRFNVAVSG